MKHFFSVLALLATTSSFAQGTSIYEYPWNPDWNNDKQIGTADLTSFLSAFGGDFGNPPEPCNYDGSTFENWASAWLNGDLIVDSCYIEYELQDAVTYYIPGCPEPITDTLIHANSYILRTPFLHASHAGIRDTGNWRSISLSYNAANGSYSWSIVSQNVEMQDFAADGFFGSSLHAQSASSTLPFPDYWTFDEEGIGLNWISGWATYANYLYILPYWHYVE